MFRSSLFLVAMELRNKKDIDKVRKLYKFNNVYKQAIQ